MSKVEKTHHSYRPALEPITGTYRPALAALLLAIAWLTSTTIEAAPWLDKRESGGIAYLIYQSPARIERYDLASSTWLSDIPLAEAPTAFFVDPGGLYVSFGRRTSRFALDGTGEFHLRNTLVDATDLVTFGDVLYINAPNTLLSANKWTGSVIDQEEYWYTMQGLSIALSPGKLFARSSGSYPSDIVQVELLAGGFLGLQGDSIYHGDYPDATRTYVFPGETRVAEDSGIVYATADLLYAGSLGGSFGDLDFHGDHPIVLRGGTIYSYSEDLVRTGQFTPVEAPLGILVDGAAVVSFFQGATGVEAEAIPIASFTMPTPGPPVDPAGLEYEPDDVALGGDGIVYMLSAVNRSIFRWSTVQNQYIETIPLVLQPLFIAYSDVNHSLYLTYLSGEITVIDLAAPGGLVEVPLVNSPQEPCGLSTAGEFVFVCDPSGAWVSHFTYNSAGTLLSQEEWNRFSHEYVWSAANRKMYFLRDDTSPNDLIWEEIDASGVLGTQMDSPYHSSDGISHPIRIAPDGSLVLLGSGRLYDGTTLEQVDTLSNDIDDALWAEGILFTVREFGADSQIQKWNLPNWGIGASDVVPGIPIRLFFTGGRLLVITSRQNRPFFAYRDLDLSLIFADDFESGDLSAWTRSGGAMAGFVSATGDAASDGLFGLEAQVGANCLADQDLVIAPPPTEIEGSFFACNSVQASGVRVGGAGVELGAGSVVALGNDFWVPDGADFTAAVDPATLSGLAFVEDSSPDNVDDYTAMWSLQIDGLTLRAGDFIEHFVGYAANGEVLFRVLFRWNSAMSENRLALEARRDDGTFATTLDLEELVVPSGWTSLEVGWRAGDGDGFLAVALGGQPFLGLGSLDNGSQRLDWVRLGHAGGTVTTSAGSLYVDDFASW